MAPKAAMKRPAAAAATAPAKRRSVGKVDPIQAKCDSVASALLEAEGLPENVREMLAHSLPSCLNLYKADRHNFQHRVVAMVGEALSEIGSKINQSIAEAEAEVTSADTRKTALDKTFDECEKTLGERKITVNSKKEALEASSAAKKTAVAALKEAEKEEKTGNKELDDAGGKKEELESFRSTTYNELIENTASKAGTQALAKLGKTFTYDTELIKALTCAFAKAPDTRGTFDKLVVSQFEEQMDKSLAGLTATLAQGEPGQQERAAKVASAKSSLEVSQVADDACCQALADARNAEDDTQKELDASKKDLAAFAPNLENTKARCNGLKAGLTEFSETSLANFKELEARAVLSPEEEQPVVETPAEGEPAPVVEGVPATA